MEHVVLGLGDMSNSSYLHIAHFIPVCDQDKSHVCSFQLTGVFLVLYKHKCNISVFIVSENSPTNQEKLLDLLVLLRRKKKFIFK